MRASLLHPFPFPIHLKKLVGRSRCIEKRSPNVHLFRSRGEHRLVDTYARWTVIILLRAIGSDLFRVYSLSLYLKIQPARQQGDLI